MRRNLFAAFASLVLAGTLMAAQDSPSSSPASREPSPQAAQQPADTPSAAETTLTGCLLQGSGPTTFILENAKAEKADKNAKGLSYVVEISAPPDKIKSVVNHQVTMVGSIAAASGAAGEAASASAAGQTAKNESAMPHFTAKRITPQSQTCSAQGD